MKRTIIIAATLVGLTGLTGCQIPGVGFGAPPIIVDAPEPAPVVGLPMADPCGPVACAVEPATGLLYDPRYFTLVDGVLVTLVNGSPILSPVPQHRGR